MGFFSWITCDTGRSICNRYSIRKTFPVYVLIPKEFGGGCLKENNYEGYGVFGGADIYSLFAYWNTGSHDRHVGIVLYHEHPEKVKYPIKIAEHRCTYESQPASEYDSAQGYFYDSDDSISSYSRKPVVRSKSTGSKSVKMPVSKKVPAKKKSATKKARR